MTMLAVQDWPMVVEQEANPCAFCGHDALGHQTRGSRCVYKGCSCDAFRPVMVELKIVTYDSTDPQALALALAEFRGYVDNAVKRSRDD